MITAMNEAVDLQSMDEGTRQLVLGLMGQLQQQSENVFMTETERQTQQSGLTVQEHQAKIGELTVENNFLERALCKLDGPSARR